MRIVRLKELVKISGLSRSTIYDQVKSGTFPQPVKLGARAIGWILSDVENWIASKAGR
ncbi:MAG: transcriptional regulator [Leptospirillum sp. Group II 'C75']|jgi:prophage regulatory protein|uniref:helix-turn-helix transcriptional regulator n=1 Tax=Leptospirillum sp. Group II 'CF-1' TaxID=1660083 RepID=UPI00029CC032|nr:AlpA family transcriptional regulator [Leptospirillum sp. Group II 'CF-1']EIJ77255.1 MAG: transcriptional regulator [Leptospirillum sp. Group II 'C75']